MKAKTWVLGVMMVLMAVVLVAWGQQRTGRRGMRMDPNMIEQMQNSIQVEREQGQVVLYTIYRGPYEQVGGPIGKLFALAGEKGMPPAGPVTLVYLNSPWEAGPEHSLTEIRIPKTVRGALWFYRKLGQRSAMAIAKVSVAFLAHEGGGVLEDVRIALGAVAPTVVGAPESARFLQGRRLGRAAIAEAARLVEAEARPITDVRSTAEYRRRMVGVLLSKGLRELG